MAGFPRGALEYLLLYANGTTPWPHENDPDHKVDNNKLVLPLLRAANGFKNPAFREQVKALSGAKWETLRERLLVTP